MQQITLKLGIMYEGKFPQKLAGSLSKDRNYYLR
jgi:hypothetical protein